VSFSRLCLSILGFPVLGKSVPWLFVFLVMRALPLFIVRMADAFEHCAIVSLRIRLIRNLRAPLVGDSSAEIANFEQVCNLLSRIKLDGKVNLTPGTEVRKEANCSESRPSESSNSRNGLSESNPILNH
jgi:hypothetical protein